MTMAFHRLALKKAKARRKYDLRSQVANGLRQEFDGRCPKADCRKPVKLIYVSKDGSYKFFKCNAKHTGKKLVFMVK